jgi:hypothetical protein
MDKAIRCQGEHAGHDAICDPNESQRREVGRCQPGWDICGIGMGRDQDQNWLAAGYWVQIRTEVPSRRSYLSASRHRRPFLANSG